MKASIAKRHLHTGASYHSIFTEGCRLSGVLEVARVPGTMHFQARHHPPGSRHGIWHMADRRHMRHMCISSMCFHLVKQETCPLGLLLVTTSP